ELNGVVKVVEVTGGSTGSSLAFVCAAKGYVFSSNAFAVEKLRTMAAFGAEVDIVQSRSGKIMADQIPRMRALAAKEVRRSRAFAADQSHNQDALLGYQTLDKELLGQVSGGIDAFCAAVDTVGMAMGVAGVLKAANPGTRVIVLEPASTSVITEGRAGAHGVEGIGVGFVSPLLDHELYDEARAVDEVEARKMCTRLAREDDVFAGVSTGLNFVAVLRSWARGGGGIVPIAYDSGVKYGVLEWRFVL
ncbi:tryptophan synthase beta subunit-like PLP-dependent enzyme, partial [Colletotrichum sublineola]